MAPPWPASPPAYAARGCLKQGATSRRPRHGEGSAAKSVWKAVGRLSLRGRASEGSASTR
eukprot:CAMPEP_0177274834 /NCGR_PEP_ID=MMETSP0367-20130122/67381_1 /TAXON_ID=447022 ORGANISM="Scrippsiella hangoei-like, Strain SHHI-4" /NCGR_SAMPLE_ID=MMETSP0367 /ASSEMBLY_ACC=CAM_ASM_000362 /LENGTH=59 /DNA_ID=CAMNT_0018731201 /DNA_START=27 /DNA_END=206 /DNA_ORIENTATION=-